MLNVVSIDLDFFFNVSEYNHLINEKVTGEQQWKMINAIDIKPKLDEKLYYKLIEMLAKKCDGNTVFKIIDEHDEILSTISEFEEENCNVYNFDFHHDINYEQNNDELHIGNWVLHGKQKGIIGEYTWIHRPLSEMIYLTPFKINRECCCDMKDIDLFKDEKIIIDKVIIVRSRHYTPKEYWNLTLDIEQSIMKNIKIKGDKNDK